MKELERFLLGLNSKMTQKYYTIYINAFLEFKKISTIEEVKLITIDDIEDWSIYLRDIGNGQNSRRVKLAALSSFYDYLIDRDIIIKNIVKIILKKIKSDTKETSWLNSSEIVYMLMNTTNDKEYAILMVFVNTGIRVSELINLKLSDYIDDKLEIINGKGGKSRTVYLNDKTKEALNDYLKVRKQSQLDNLFISDQGTILDARSLNNTIKKLARKAHIEKNISCHSLRRTAATGLYKKGVDILTIKNVLGHSSIQTTQIYIKNQTIGVKEAMLKNGFGI